MIGELGGAADAAPVTSCMQAAGAPTSTVPFQILESSGWPMPVYGPNTSAYERRYDWLILPVELLGALAYRSMGLGKYKPRGW